jgi:hypothetical protein
MAQIITKLKSMSGFPLASCGNLRQPTQHEADGRTPPLMLTVRRTLRSPKSAGGLVRRMGERRNAVLRLAERKKDMQPIWNSSYGNRRAKLRPGEKTVARKKPQKVKTVSPIRAAEQRDAPVHAGQPCPSCNGYGELLDKEAEAYALCPECEGTGSANRPAGG